MTYRTIATFLHDPQAPTSAFECAIGLARRFAAHLSVVAPGIDRSAPGTYFGALRAVAIQKGLGHVQQAATELKAQIEARLAGEVIAWDLDDRLLQGSALAPFLAERVRYADLVVLPAPYSPARSAEDVAALEAVLFGARRPVLVVPDGCSDPPQGDSLLVAWNESDEALNTIRAALPFMQEASTSDITIIDPPQHGAGRSDPGGALARYINRHGANAEIAILARSEPRVADILIRRARERGSDMIVMGAYGHTRMREAILGGATRDMLEASDVPVLMAH